MHTRYQQIAMLDTVTGEVVTRRLEHENGEARAFCASLAKPALVGMEATGCTQWFELLIGCLASLHQAGRLKKESWSPWGSNRWLVGSAHRRIQEASLGRDDPKRFH